MKIFSFSMDDLNVCLARPLFCSIVETYENEKSTYIDVLTVTVFSGNRVHL